MATKFKAIDFNKETCSACSFEARPCFVQEQKKKSKKQRDLDFRTKPVEPLSGLDEEKRKAVERGRRVILLEDLYKDVPEVPEVKKEDALEAPSKGWALWHKRRRSGRNSLQVQFEPVLAKPVVINKAASMMQKMGWTGGALGRTGDGIVEPIAPNLDYARKTKGFGHDPPPSPPKLSEKMFRRLNVKRNSDCFEVNVLRAILSFVKNERETELLFDCRLDNGQRRRIHRLIEDVQCGRAGAGGAGGARARGELARAARARLTTRSEGQPPYRYICIYKEAPEHMCLITHHELRGQPRFVEDNYVPVHKFMKKKDRKRLQAIKNLLPPGADHTIPRYEASELKNKDPNVDVYIVVNKGIEAIVIQSNDKKTKKGKPVKAVKQDNAKTVRFNDDLQVVHHYSESDQDGHSIAMDVNVEEEMAFNDDPSKGSNRYKDIDLDDVVTELRGYGFYTSIKAFVESTSELDKLDGHALVTKNDEVDKEISDVPGSEIKSGEPKDVIPDINEHAVDTNHYNVMAENVTSEIEGTVSTKDVAKDVDIEDEIDDAMDYVVVDPNICKDSKTEVDKIDIKQETVNNDITEDNSETSVVVSDDYVKIQLNMPTFGGVASDQNFTEESFELEDAEMFEDDENINNNNNNNEPLDDPSKIVDNNVDVTGEVVRDKIVNEEVGTSMIVSLSDGIDANLEENEKTDMDCETNDTTPKNTGEEVQIPSTSKNNEIPVDNKTKIREKIMTFFRQFLRNPMQSEFMFLGNFNEDEMSVIIQFMQNISHHIHDLPVNDEELLALLNETNVAFDKDCNGATLLIKAPKIKKPSIKEESCNTHMATHSSSVSRQIRLDSGLLLPFSSYRNFLVKINVDPN